MEPSIDESSPPPSPIRGEAVVEAAREEGFPLVGITDAAPIERPEAYLNWIEAGAHGEMGYLSENTELRIDPTKYLEGAKSLIVVAEQYAPRGTASGASPDGGKIARYAQGKDYHKVLKSRLLTLSKRLEDRHPGHEWRCFTDTAPVMERDHAVRAGLGWIGKHTLLIHTRRGSWHFLGGIATTAHIAPPRNQRTVTDHCGTCTRCIEACPTDAITPYRVDATRCISYLTIEHRSAIATEFFAPIGDWLYGCDICQEVCPHNSARSGRIGQARARQEYAPTKGPSRTDGGTGFDLLEVLGWTEDDRRAALVGSAMKRAKLDMWQRNALIVAGNRIAEGRDDDAALRERVQDIAARAEPGLVKETAVVVLERINRGMPSR